MLLETGQDVVDLKVGGLDGVPQPVHAPAQLGQLPLDGLKLHSLFASHAVHLFVDEPHQCADVALAEDVLAKLLDDESLKVLRVQPWRVATALAPLDEGLAHVVGVPAAFGLSRRERPVARLALGQPAEKVGAGRAAGMDLGWRLGLQHPLHSPELLGGDDRGEGILDTHGAEAVLGGGAPDQGSGVGLVGEHRVDGRLVPALAPGARDALVVEYPGDGEDALALEGHIEDAAHHGIRGRVQLQLLTLAGTVLYLDLAVPVGRDGSDPEATGR
ncbi:MAG: hypothetical protein OXG61_05855 [Chloroflexi bacterium]|nr:hypothetical protein [Chloroflexota bacterium]